ncbi:MULTISPECIES: hypothetical protein [Mangrovicoccus]|nr:MULTISPECIES: hypothetical protein [Mangrovicoccus]
MRLLKVLAFLLIVAGIGLVGFAYFGNLSPDRTEMTIPVELGAQ